MDAQEEEQANQRQIEWIDTFRALHRTTRMVGYLGCVLGAALMLWGRFGSASAPSWAIPIGLTIIIASWFIFLYVVYARWQWAKRNPPHT